MKLLLCILLYHGILPTPGRPLSLQDDFVAILYDGEGNSFVGLLKAAVDIARKWGVGQRYLGMIQLLEHEMNRPEDDDCPLALCRSEIPKSEACDLLVQ